jgi:spermidine/putrescine transport system permease protein
MSHQLQGPPSRAGGPDVERKSASKPPRALRLRHFPSVFPVAVLALVFLYVPMVVVVAYAFNKGDQALLWEGFSVDWFGKVVRNPDLVDSTIVSLRLAIGATAIATAMALGIALVLDRWGRRTRGVAMALIQAPLIVPEIVAAVGTLGFIRILGLRPGFTALLLAHVAFCIPFALLPLRARLAELDPAIFEAGADLGARGGTLLRRVTLPLLVPGIASGAMLAFIISLDDFIISSFLSSADSTTLPVYLFGLIRKGVSPAINAVATILLLVSTVAVLLSYVITQRREKS